MTTTLSADEDDRTIDVGATVTVAYVHLFFSPLSLSDRRPFYARNLTNAYYGVPSPRHDVRDVRGSIGINCFRRTVRTVSSPRRRVYKYEQRTRRRRGSTRSERVTITRTVLGIKYAYFYAYAPIMTFVRFIVCSCA